MLELGAYAPAAHREVGEHVPGRADVLVTVGELGREIAQAARRPAPALLAYTSVTQPQTR